MMKRQLALTSALILASAAIAMAAPVPTIELVPNGTSFSVMASNFTKVSGFQMLIQYNPLALQNPQVSAGEMIVGGIFMPNVSASRNTVNIALSNAFKTIEGSGKLATISFSAIPGGASKGNVNILGNGYKFTSDNATKTVAVRLVSSAEQNLGKLENDAIVACLNDSLCTPIVKPDGTVDLSYKAKTPVNGQCGSINGTTVNTVPTANLCSQGTPSSLSGNGPWYWKCTGTDGGSSADCVVTKTPDAINGTCGVATGSSFTSMPTDNLCSTGIASMVTEGDSWMWSCVGVNGGTQANCSAKKNASQQDGKCGASNGISTSSKPMLLCSSGTPSEVTESSSLWAWSCSGANGGRQVNCTAPTPASLPTQFAAQTGQTSAIAFVTQSVEQPATTTDKKSDSQPLVTDLRKDMTIPVGGTETPAATSAKNTAEQVKETESKFVSYKNALQYFASYKGERNPKNLMALFAEPAIPSFSQEPPIALADGKGLVKIKLLVIASGSELPKFIMQGATLKNLPIQGEDGFWTMEALPKKGVHEAKLTVIDGDRMFEFPLTVVPVAVPVLGKDKKFSEADFARFLEKPAKYDLNGDKKFDYIDDYIYTANYMVALKIKPEKIKVGQPKIVEDGKKKEVSKSKDGKAGNVPEKAAPKPVEP